MMSKAPKNILLLFLITLALTGSISGQTRMTAQSIMNFLNIAVGARAAGMGDCYLAGTPEADIIFWNPAGIAELGGRHLFVDQNNWFADIRQQSVAFTYELGNLGNIGFSLVSMDYGDIYGTEIDIASVLEGGFEYTEIGKLKIGNYALGVAYARSISEQFSVGINLRYAYSDLGSSTVGTLENLSTIDNTLGVWFVDIGTQYRTGYRGLALSMSVRNFSRQAHYPRMEQDYYLPLVFSIGFTVDALQFIIPGIKDHALEVAAAVLHPKDYLEKGNLGAEYSFKNRVFIRSGLKINYGLETSSMGFGIRQPFGDQYSITIDYSYSNVKYFDGVSRVSISIAF